MGLMRRRIRPAIIAVWLALLLGAGATAIHAEDFEIESAGVRYGISANTASKEFDKVDAFANWNLPWAWRFGSDSNWRLKTRLDLSAGWFGKHADNAGIFSAGGTLALTYREFPVSIELGVSPGIITRDQFGDT